MMIIKSFTAETMTAALKTVRQELGGEAVVLKTRQLSNGVGANTVEVTACLDTPTVAQASMALRDVAEGPQAVTVSSSESKPAPKSRLAPETFTEPETEALAKTNTSLNDRLNQIERKLNLLLHINNVADFPDTHRGEDIRSILTSMREADLPDDFAEHLMTKALASVGESGSLRTELGRLFENEMSSMVCPELKFKAGDRLLIMGPAASGKTSLMGKLAADLIKQGSDKIRLTTLDNCKVGAHDEIQSYADLLGAELTTPAREEDKKSAVDECIELVDSPALPRQSERIEELKTEIDRLNPNYRFLTISALTRPSDIEEFAKWLRPLEPTHLVLTMLDLTERWGTVVAACRATGLPLAFVIESPGGIGQALTPNARQIVASILNEEAIGE
jgi:flagellar biosynthesis protein FlhF